MRRHALAVALAASFLASFASAPASADDEKKPDRAHAAEQFDAGVGAFKKKDFESAATHFEAANAAAPSATALRQAIRAHVEAGQGARAATLSVIALSRYPSDPGISKLSKETIEKFEPILHKAHVKCATPCSITQVTQVPLAVPGDPATKWIVYLDPGSARLTATFASGGAPLTLDVDAKAGGEEDLNFEPRKKATPPPPVEPPVSVGDKDKPAKASELTTRPTNPETPPDEPKPEEPQAERKGISPAFFIVGTIVTVGLGATSVWSGIDTQNNPGAAAVKAGCAGQGTSCALYQEGLSKQTRTNALIGTTAGAGAVTILFAIFTRWGGAKKPPPAEPTALVVDHGAVLGAAGRF